MLNRTFISMKQLKVKCEIIYGIVSKNLPFSCNQNSDKITQDPEGKLIIFHDMKIPFKLGLKIIEKLNRFMRLI